MTDINKGTKVYALIASSGSYDDYSSWTESVHKTKDGAEKAKQIFDEAHLLKGEFPMTEDQWSELRYGIDEKLEEVQFVDRGGFTAEQFKLMDTMMNNKHDDYHPCEIQEFKLQE